MPFPFEASFDEVQANLDVYVDEVFGCLESEFLVMPKGNGFIEFATFETGYKALKRATKNFQDVTPATVAPAVYKVPISLVVLRCLLERFRFERNQVQPAPHPATPRVFPWVAGWTPSTGSGRPVVPIEPETL